MITAYALRFATVSIMTFLFSLCPVSMAAQAITLQFQLHAYIDDFGTHRGPNKPRLPAYSPNVTLYDHPDCTVQLLEGDDVVFEVPFFPYTANNINLPDALSGQYELRIVEVGYYFSAVIELE